MYSIFMIIYILHQTTEKIRFFCTKPFQETLIHTPLFKEEYPIPHSFIDCYDIDNNFVWGQMSAHFRLYKNLKDNDIIGFGQFRRTFKSQNPLRQIFHLPLSKKEMRKYLSSNDAIITTYYIPPENDTAFQRFEYYRGGTEEILKIIKKQYPELIDSIEEMKNKPGAYWNGPNIIAKSAFLKDYYDKLFSFLFEAYSFYKNNLNIINNKRYLDYCGELFFAIYFYNESKTKNNIKELPYIEYKDTFFRVIFKPFIKIKRFIGRFLKSKGLL